MKTKKKTEQKDTQLNGVLTLMQEPEPIRNEVTFFSRLSSLLSSGIWIKLGGSMSGSLHVQPPLLLQNLWSLVPTIQFQLFCFSQLVSSSLFCSYPSRWLSRNNRMKMRWIKRWRWFMLKGPRNSTRLTARAAHRDSKMIVKK